MKERHVEIIVEKYDGRVLRRIDFDRSTQGENGMLEFHSDFPLRYSEGGEEKIFPFESKLFLFPEKWFNIFLFYDGDQRFHRAYCNIATPPEIRERDITFVDLDIDVVITQAYEIEVLDMHEFKSNSETYGYPPEVVHNALQAVDEIRQMVAIRKYPFCW